MSRIKVVKFKGCSNIQISKALIELSSELISSCGEDEILKKNIISLAIQGWNLSLYQDSDENYLKKIQSKLPKNLPENYCNIIKSFLLKLIRQKQKEYPDYFKGITSFNVKFEKGETLLTVNALPVKPV
ncbi:MAG: hypothetical protein RBR08_02230 [Desulforegulaceae bacterium]|nr:hypothetical protein [Desulforegulaceae bacterium]